MTALLFTGLPASDFAVYTKMNDAELGQHGAKRIIADDDGYPCRISLRRAQPGETLILLAYEHHPARSPYRAAGPIFIRQTAHQTGCYHNILPPMLADSLLSLRAYDQTGMMQYGAVATDREALAAIRAQMADQTIAYLHIHFARRGCYACRVERDETGGGLIA